MAKRGSAYGKYKPCKWCGSSNTVVASSARMLCKDCGKTTGKFGDRNRNIAESERLKRPWCIKCRIWMWKRSGNWFRCPKCGVQINLFPTKRAILMMNLRLEKRPDCPFCGHPNPYSKGGYWACQLWSCKKTWPKKRKPALMPPQIEEVIIDAN